MDADAVSSLLEEHAADAERHHVQGTPTILVGPTGGELKHVRLTSPGDVTPLERAIGDALLGPR